jgi:hypothetical protein
MKIILEEKFLIYFEIEYFLNVIFSFHISLIFLISLLRKYIFLNNKTSSSNKSNLSLALKYFLFHDLDNMLKPLSSTNTIGSIFQFKSLRLDFSDFSK